MFNSQVQAAIDAGAAAIMTWQVLPMIIDTVQTYDYTWDSDGGEVIKALTTYATCLVGPITQIDGDWLVYTSFES